jgi:hypothetical protein
MSKILISFFILLSVVHGAKKSNWTHTHKYTLKKDEVANIGTSTTESKGLDKSSLFFRWTTIVGDRVTVLLNHKGYPHQYILYKKRSLDRVKLYLLPDGASRMVDRTYLLLVLTDINQDKQEVSFDILIEDKKNRILVEF